MSTTTPLPSRGRTWFQALADKTQPIDTGLGSVLVADAPLALPSPPLVGGEGRVRAESERVRLLAIVPDSRNRFPRARHGEPRARRSMGARPLRT